MPPAWQAGGQAGGRWHPGEPELGVGGGHMPARQKKYRYLYLPSEECIYWRQLTPEKVYHPRTIEIPSRLHDT